MFRCVHCNKLYKGKKGNCPHCGKPCDSWEPVQEQAKVPPIPVMMQRILNYKIHFDQD